MNERENFDRIVNALSAIPRDGEFLPDITLAADKTGSRFVLVQGARFCADGLQVSVELDSAPKELSVVTSSEPRLARVGLHDFVSRMQVSVHIESGHGTFETEYRMPRETDRTGDPADLLAEEQQP